MKRDVAKKWVAKLRSGEYEQGRGYLNDDGRMCCLGVLCEVAIEDGLALAKSYDHGDADTAVGYGVRVETAGLPMEVVDWADLGGQLPNSTIRDGKGFPLGYHYLNDISGYSFEQIADVVESQFIDR